MTILQRLIKPIFGQFEDQEYRKFLRMGAVFAFIIGSYWTLRPLKKAIFCTLVGASDTPIAKLSAVILLIPLIMGYTKLIDIYKREKTFYIISGIYGALALVFTLLLAFVPTTQACKLSISGFSINAATLLGYAFYLFVETYGSMIPALFWSIAADTTTPDSAKKRIFIYRSIRTIGRNRRTLLYCGIATSFRIANKCTFIINLRSDYWIIYLLLASVF